ncbi:hypothetical protein BIV60_26650 [Bacillus sp. MUM 116]|uniref:DUF3899 domain-containing protein n=1 Tax=Bacillus sp. MUM 116 TaxID=1678002 RepID=UPI0008F5B618|nr:DUF3899 domain-containing protein [Bacillus sp. MUM 116]OIK08363.1 hypothetical protein BIV60_26650 [Bacillus sp. MUM 116]
MNFRFGKTLIISAVFQLLIFFLSFIIYQGISLVSYINISFYISFVLLLLSLVIYTIKTGFFDTIAKSFNFAATRGKEKRTFSEIPSLSEMVTINQKPLVFHGLIMGILMLIALGFYYV